MYLSSSIVEGYTFCRMIHHCCAKRYIRRRRYTWENNFYPINVGPEMRSYGAIITFGRHRPLLSALYSIALNEN